MIRKMFSTITLIAALLGTTTGLAAQQDGAEIARKSFDLPSTDSLRMSVQLVLIDSKGVRRSRNIELVQQDGGDGEVESRQFVNFISPRDVAGTKFLSLKKSRQQDGRKSSYTQTRMYTPGDNKIRSITSSSKKNSFMGTDFSYYDLESHDYEDFSYTLVAGGQSIADKSFAGRSFYTVKAVPYDREAPYDYMIYWIDQQSYQTRRIEAFENQVKVKDIYVLQNIANPQYYIPKILLAVNYQKNGHRTVWSAQGVEINPEIEARTFSVQNLK